MVAILSVQNYQFFKEYYLEIFVINRGNSPENSQNLFSAKSKRGKVKLVMNFFISPIEDNFLYSPFKVNLFGKKLFYYYPIGKDRRSKFV